MLASAPTLGLKERHGQVVEDADPYGDFFDPGYEKPPPKRGLEAVDKVVGIAITVRKRV